MFMQPQAQQMRMLHIETTIGTEVIPADLVGETPTATALRDYLEGTPYADDKTGKLEEDSWDLETGWYARFSAPGYLDCTDWVGPEDSEGGALAALADLHDVCASCFETCWDSAEGDCQERASG